MSSKAHFLSLAECACHRFVSSIVSSLFEFKLEKYRVFRSQLNIFISVNAYLGMHRCSKA